MVTHAAKLSPFPLNYIRTSTALSVATWDDEKGKSCFVFLWKILLLNWGYFYGFSLQHNSFENSRRRRMHTNRNRIILFTQLRNWREWLIGDDGNNKYRLDSSTVARAIAMSKWKLSDRFFHRSLRLVDVCRRWLFLLHRRLLFLRKWQHKGNARVNFHPIVLLSAALSPCGINYEMLCERKRLAYTCSRDMTPVTVTIPIM